MANNLQLVQGYVTIAEHILSNELCVVKTLDKEYQNWDVPETYGTRGQTFLAKMPTRLTPSSGLTFNPDGNVGSFVERTISISADQLTNLPYPITNVESATFKTKDIISDNGRTSINEMANQFEKFAIESVANSGYRFVGNPAAAPGQMQTVSDVTIGVSQFQSFGCAGLGNYFIMPMLAAARTIQTGLQQFVTKRNDDLALKGEIGQLGGVNGVTFCQNNLLGKHIAGTLSEDAANLSTGFTIVSVTPDNIINPDDGAGTNTSTVVITGTPGLTILENDLIDIGQLNTISPLNFLTFTGYADGEAPVQGRVIADAVEAPGGTYTFQIQPALIFDVTETNSFRNLSRDIIAGVDTIRIVKSHSRGLLYYGNYGKWVAPTLPDTEPFPGGSVRSADTGVSFRAYYGQVGIGDPTKYFVHDAIYGYGSASEGFARVIYPLNLTVNA